jgi:hypothetical protein
MQSAFDPLGTRLPIKLDPTSNGEFAPIPLAPVHDYANRIAHQRAGEYAAKLGQTRRQFLTSLCGAASTLLAMNKAYAAAGRAGGYFALAKEAALDSDAAFEALGKREFIFDVQGHFVNPQGAWLKTMPPRAKPLAGLPNAGCARADPSTERGYLQCFGPDAFIKDVFMDSDTDMMVLSFVPSRADAEPLTIEEAAAVRETVDKLQGSHRLILHGRVNPNQAGDLARMDELVWRWKIAAWKTYTQWGPDDKGFWMTDDVGLRFIEKARKLGVKNIAIHKGIPFGQRSYEHSLCDDIGKVAKRYPDVNFLIYHSGFVPGKTEGPFAPARNEGIDSLIKTVVDNGLPRNGSNVYAELGSTWRFLMRDPDSAAHALGKLFKYLGEDNVLWGTDSIWYGSPQDQIQAFRTFQISKAMQDKYGYPEITPKLRAKVFGLNAMKPYGIRVDEVKQRAGSDAIARTKLAYSEHADPNFVTYGPKNRREFLNLMKWGGRL